MRTVVVYAQQSARCSGKIIPFLPDLGPRAVLQIDVSVGWQLMLVS